MKRNQCNRSISLEEQLEAMEYVKNKRLVVPSTNIYSLILFVSTFFIALVKIYLVIYFLLCFFDLFEYIDPYINRGLFLFLLFIFLLIIMFCFVAKSAFIGICRLYQHYAKESTRRKCRCKPTCSEYAILVLQKHCVVVALYKIYVRLFKTCRGQYKVDEP